MPGMTIGGLLGRLVGQLAFQHDLIEGRQRGTFALIGTAAVLGGMTRMTLTLSVILAELTNDVALLPALMFTLAISRAVGDALNHSFDDMMIHIQGLPYLEFKVYSLHEVEKRPEEMSLFPPLPPEATQLDYTRQRVSTLGYDGMPIGIVAGSGAEMSVSLDVICHRRWACLRAFPPPSWAPAAPRSICDSRTSRCSVAPHRGPMHV